MSWDGTERRQAQLEIHELLREEMKDTVQPLVERVEKLERSADKWDTALMVLRWAAAVTIAGMGVIAQAIDWAKEHWR